MNGVKRGLALGDDGVARLVVGGQLSLLFGDVLPVFAAGRADSPTGLSVLYEPDDEEKTEADPEEPLEEKISTEWIRLNLRAAKACGKTAEELVVPLCCSAKMKPLSFTRQDVYNFCVKLDGSEAMKAAAGKVLEEGWLPRHSEKYREAYAPAYRVMYKDYRKFRQEDR